MKEHVILIVQLIFGFNDFVNFRSIVFKTPVGKGFYWRFFFFAVLNLCHFPIVNDSLSTSSIIFYILRPQHPYRPAVLGCRASANHILRGLLSRDFGLLGKPWLSSMWSPMWLSEYVMWQMIIISETRVK
jgi:hypothetical protein